MGECISCLRARGWTGRNTQHRYSRIPSGAPKRESRTKPRVLHVNCAREEKRYADRPRRCLMCELHHGIKDYKELIDASTVTRIESAKKLRLCFCVWSMDICPGFTRETTNVYGCRIRHHYLIHDPAGHSNRPPVADGGRTRDQRSSQDRQLYRDSIRIRKTNATFCGFQRGDPVSCSYRRKSWGGWEAIEMWSPGIIASELELCRFELRSLAIPDLASDVVRG